MVYAKLAYLAFIVCFWQVSDAQNLRRVRHGSAAPGVEPHVPAPAPTPYRRDINNLIARCRYECNLEEIISKLINALIYTALHKDGGASGGSRGSGGAGGSSGGGAGGGKGSGSGGRGNSLLDLNLDLLSNFDSAKRDDLTGTFEDDSSLIDIGLNALGRQLLGLNLLGGKRND